MSTANTRLLLEAAAEILGGEDRLAEYLNVDATLLRAYLKGRRPFPDLLLLRTVDVLLNNMRRRLSSETRQTSPSRSEIQGCVDHG
jgi:hypothetical protein